MASIPAEELEEQRKGTDKDGSPGGERTLREALITIIGGLQQEADDRVGKRDLIEKRWLDDLRQYHGKYQPRTETELTQDRKSRLFINQTRAKTNAMEARLSDMLFPTDDRNWGIRPTPVPELTVEAEEAAEEAASLRQQAVDAYRQQLEQQPPPTGTEEEGQKPPLNQRAQQAETLAQQAETRARQIQARQDEARKRARSMEEQIDDNLRECRYAIQSRDVIRDACRLGTGIMKGPVVGDRIRRRWRKIQDDPNVYEMIDEQDPKPVYWRVDPWSLFPDMDATSEEDCESWFERHLMNRKELRKLAKQPGFSEDAIRRLLRDQPRHTTPTYIADLRSITGTYHDTTINRYHVWEYHGALSVEDISILAQALNKPDVAEDVGLNDQQDIDPLMEVQVVIWFCQNEVLKFGLHHLDSGDQIYSVFCLEKDEASIFGFGLPYIMRDGQSALNAGWRTMMDNSGLSSGPQTVVNKDVVEPANGLWGLEARKVWLRKSGAPSNAPAFEVYDIPSHQTELANIVEMARRNIDEETSMPMIAQGEQGSHTTETAHGMSILMNSVNVVFRRIVKNWDDDMTVPNIRRIYDWQMQFSDKDYIKGDYEIEARGTSVLLVREMQSANLMAFLINFGAHPTLAPFLKEGGLPALRNLVKTMMIPADELIKSDEELAEEEAKNASLPPEPNPEVMKIEAQLNQAEIERETKLEIAMLNRETEMMKLAGQHNMRLDELRARLEEGRQNRQSDERKQAVETAMTQRHGPSGGGYY